MSITLDEDLQEFVRTRVANDGFRKPEEYVIHLIREHRARLVARHELNTEIEAGLNSPVSDLTNDEVLARLRHRASAGQ